ncbi:MAG: ABC transporter ATP-binding protein [Candidatus Bathyarchaeota archaeon]|nr:ABC transporter ATP-binding protein [Candidatus Bathyarchaeota archaeon]
MVTLQVQDLNFSYENGFSLKDISFSADAGQLCAFFGPNACGKTTLIKCLCDIFKMRSGSILFNDVDLTKLKSTGVSKILSYVPQIHEASFSYSVMEMVLMGRNPYVNHFSTPRKSDLNKSENALATLNLQHLRNESFTEISGGQQKLVLIARALAQETPIMLLDEPTAHLDFKNKLLVLKGIKKLVKEQGLIVLMSLHDPNEVLLVADQVIMMNNGKIISQGTTEQILTVENIKAIYDVDAEIWRSGTKKVFVPSMNLETGDFT